MNDFWTLCAVLLVNWLNKVSDPDLGGFQNYRYTIRERANRSKPVKTSYQTLTDPATASSVPSDCTI